VLKKWARSLSFATPNEPLERKKSEMMLEKPTALGALPYT
jgi:hypothetical protein